MSDQVQQPVSQVADDEIDLRELFSALWQGKWIIIVTTFLFSVASVFYALSLPDIYKSEVTLAPVSEDSGLKIPGQLGGLAALAGVNLGGAGGGDKTILALEILKSRDFLGRFILENDLYIPIFASTGWDLINNKLIIDPKIYDEISAEWVRVINPPFKAKPSIHEVVDSFKKSLSISQDKMTGIVKLSVSHYSPYLAKDIADKLVSRINEEMRKRDLEEAELSIIYLNSQIMTTTLADVRNMLYSLIEEQTKTLMIANVRREYVFKTIDPAIVPEFKAKPYRALISALGFGFGLLISIFFLLTKFFLSNRK
ncbi:Wzz/FepE/Etk N-terminal domain-containing protein [Alishewanella aestuarii]|nr:Wzz/FepE/Etk N-terminal domain-containing protein [Alishewanella aestuarii]